jgi:hypothetical protein
VLRPLLSLPPVGLVVLVLLVVTEPEIVDEALEGAVVVRLDPEFDDAFKCQ